MVKELREHLNFEGLLLVFILHARERDAWFSSARTLIC